MNASSALLLSVVASTLVGGTPPEPALPAAVSNSSPYEAVRVRILDDTRSATLARAFAEYDLLIGNFSTVEITGTTFRKVTPIGDGVHVLEIGWRGSAGSPQHITIPSNGAVYLNANAIIIDFLSSDDTLFGAMTDQSPSCDGTYSNVLSVTTSGNCWGKKIVNENLETWPCNKASEIEDCHATITFTSENGGDPVNPVFKCRGGGSVDFNPVTQIAHANGAKSGC